MATAILPDLSSDFKVVPHHPPPRRDDADPTGSDASVSLLSGTFQFVSSPVFTGSSFEYVSSSAIDERKGMLYLLRSRDPVVVVLDSNGTPVSSWTAAQTGIKSGSSIKYRHDGGQTTVWVVDMGSSCIRPFDDTGHPYDPIGPHIYPETFGQITDVAWDSIGNFYVADGNPGGPNNRVVLLNPVGLFLASWGTQGPLTQPLRFEAPISVAVDVISRVWVVDSLNSRIQVVSWAGDSLGELVFEGYKVLDIAFSNVRCEAQNAIAYVSASPLIEANGVGVIFLVQTPMNASEPGNIGTLPPLLAWTIPRDTPGTMEVARIAVGKIGSPDAVLVLGNSAPNLPNQSAVFELSAPRPLLKFNPSRKPLWPNQFRAVALLHPFTGSEDLVVAEVLYYAENWIYFDMYTMDGVRLRHLYILEGQTLQLWIDNGLGFEGPYSTTAILPTPDWIVNAGADFQGYLPLRHIQTAWWHQQFGLQQEANWHWFQADTMLPFRTMNMNDSNPNKLPVLGDYAFIYWPTFEALPDVHLVFRGLQAEITLLKPTRLADDISSMTGYIPKLLLHLTEVRQQSNPTTREKNIKKLPDLIPGLEPGDGGLPLPRWPDEFFMSCTMTPVNRPTPMSTEVTYKWPIKSQRTRMFAGNQQSADDAALFGGNTHIFKRFADGAWERMDDIPGLGPPRPDWATAGQGKIAATITNNPVLSPNTVTRIFSCPVNEPYQFWIWYSTNDTPVVFMQTSPNVGEGTSLALADYKIMQLTTLIDPHTFDLPYPWP